MLESIVLPGKVVREGYTTAHVVTTAGKVLSGILHRETVKEIVLRDPRADASNVLQTAGTAEHFFQESLVPASLLPFVA